MIFTELKIQGAHSAVHKETTLRKRSKAVCPNPNPGHAGISRRSCLTSTDPRNSSMRASAQGARGRALTKCQQARCRIFNLDRLICGDQARLRKETASRE
ncbi:hypothetical protein LIA77_09522 [Sarocladium implicatum]|nr:hypothetical protein LIA77_09522 [Sarocladium implicatum]